MSDRCSWCGHVWPHLHPCRGRIQTSGGKKPATAPCPCARNTEEGR